MTDFLPSDYKVPKTSGYMKFVQGENKFRVLSTSIIGMEGWKDKKPQRFTMEEYDDDTANICSQFENGVSHFWAFVVWNYNDKCIQILEIKQMSIMDTIAGLVGSPDWGKPFDYDITVTRKGEGMQTKYMIQPCPKKELDKDIKAKYEATNINLEALFAGDDPYEVSDTDTSIEDIPFVE